MRVVVVIDYGVGNLGSVMRALDELRVDPDPGHTGNRHARRQTA